MLIPDVDAATTLCAVIGNPVAHSLSPAIHNAAYAACGLPFEYQAFKVEDVEPFLDEMRGMKNFRGVSVTIPHKRAVMEHLDEMDAQSRMVGSVNTITNADGRLVGATTDGLGTLNAFEECGVSLEGRRVLFLGTGGAVRAVAFAMASHPGVESICILGRTAGNVEQLVKDIGEYNDIQLTGGSLSEDLEEAMSAHDVIVQGTPIGMQGNSVGESCVPKELLREEQVVFDMVYRPLRTRLLEDAEEVGCTVISGREMLIHQAALQFQIWTGQEAPLTAMREAFDRAV